MVTTVTVCVEGDEFGSTCRTSGRTGSEGSREATRRLPRCCIFRALMGETPRPGPQSLQAELLHNSKFTEAATEAL